MKSNEELQKERITEAYLRAIKRVAGLKPAPIEKVREMARVFLAETPPADPAYHGWKQGGEITADNPLGDTWTFFGELMPENARATLQSNQHIPKEAMDLETLLSAFGDSCPPEHMITVRDLRGKWVISTWRRSYD